MLPTLLECAAPPDQSGDNSLTLAATGDRQMACQSSRAVPDRIGAGSGDWFGQYLQADGAVSVEVLQLERRLAELDGATAADGTGSLESSGRGDAADCAGGAHSGPCLQSIAGGFGTDVSPAVTLPYSSEARANDSTAASLHSTLIALETASILSSAHQAPTTVSQRLSNPVGSSSLSAEAHAIGQNDNNISAVSEAVGARPAASQTGAHRASDSATGLQSRALCDSSRQPARPAVSAERRTQSRSVSPKSTQTAAVRTADMATLAPSGGRLMNQQCSLGPTDGRCVSQSAANTLFGEANCPAVLDSCASVYEQIMESLGLPCDDSSPVAMETAGCRANARASCAEKPPPTRPGASRGGRGGASAAVASRNSAPLKSTNARLSSSEQKSRDPPARQPSNQKSASTDVTQRYLTFIDELIHEKKELAVRCEQLATQTCSIEAKYQQQLNALREKHKQQMQTLKRSMSEAEKTKRQKWMDSEKEKIKEMTARGMQSQIEQMAKQHADELARVRDMYECRMTAPPNCTAIGGVSSGVPLPFGAVASVAEQQLRSRLLLEKDEALQQARLRFESQLGDSVREREAAVAALQQRTSQLQEQLATAEQAACSQQQQAEIEFERRLSELRDQLTSQSRSECAQLHTEFQQKEQQLRDSLRAETEDALKQQREELYRDYDNRLSRELQRVKEERDTRVEEVIVRLEQEMRRTEESEAQRYADKLRAQEEKYAADMRALEASEERYKCRYLDCRGRLAERDEELLDMRTRLARKDTEIGEMKQTAELLQQEQQQLGDVIESEFRGQLSELRQSSVRWQQRLREAETQHATELNDAKHMLENLQQKRRLELEALHKQIKEAFSVKEKRIGELQCSLQHSQRKTLQLERLIDKMQMDGCQCGVRSDRQGAPQLPSH